jgi:ornithine--oxo-acid transaminase
MEEGILCKDAHETVLRFAPPLVIERKDIDWAVERIGKVLRSAHPVKTETARESVSVG